MAIRCLKYMWVILIQAINLSEAALIKFGVIKREALMNLLKETEVDEQSEH